MRKSKLTKKAEKMVMSIGAKTCDKKPGEWIKRYGKHFPLDEFKAEHFDHITMWPKNKK